MNIETIIQELNRLNVMSKKLDISEPERSKMIQQTADYANTFMSDRYYTKGFNEKEVGDLAIRNQKLSLAELLSLYQEEVVESGISSGSPKHLGYIPGGGVFAAALADFIAAVTNPYSSVYFSSPGAATIENEVVEWLKRVFSFPQSAVGCLSSGGSISTLIAFTAARDKYKVKNEAVPKSVVYLSKQVHHSTQKALRIIGLEDVLIRYIPLDNMHRIIPEALDELIEQDKAEGFCPFLIVATAGTTDSGTVDPLNEIANVSDKHKLWFHVDAAYGGFFILTSKKNLFKGIERADSLIVDPHKGLFIPSGVGAVLIKDSDSVLHSHYYTANYMQDGHNEGLLKSSANLSPELTKHFRGLRVWLPLQLHGVEPFSACLEEKLLLVKYFRIKLNERGFCLGPDPDLSVSYFWYPFRENTDQRNQQLINEIHKDGSVFLSSSLINNRFVIRIAILSFLTKKETVDEAIEMIERCLKKVLLLNDCLACVN